MKLLGFFFNFFYFCNRFMIYHKQMEEGDHNSLHCFEIIHMNNNNIALKDEGKEKI